jgi:hypothetical protein
LLLSALAIASWCIDFSPVAAEFVWLVQRPEGPPCDFLLGAGICLGFTLSCSLAWAAVLARFLLG